MRDFQLELAKVVEMQEQVQNLQMKIREITHNTTFLHELVEHYPECFSINWIAVRRMVRRSC